jgi:uroporphyrinogen decarboxylase
MKQMTSKERIEALLAFREPDRIGMTDAYWEDTLASWRKQGLPALAEPTDYFGFDIDIIYMDASLRLAERLVEETEEYTIREDKHGFTAKQWRGRAGALGYLDHKIKTREDWERVKHRLTVDYGGTSRINTVSYFQPFVEYPTWDAMAASYQEIRQRQRFVLLVVYGPHEANWRKHGFEETLMDYVLDPGFLADMSRTHTDLVIDTLDKALGHGIKPDGLFITEDLGINTGLMFSPKAYEQVLFREHLRLGDYLHTHDMAYFMHSDGDIRRLIPRLIDAGIQVLQPLEAKAHLDVRELKREYGRDLTFMGNIDVQKMSASRAELEEEVRTKLEVAKQGGGYIYHSDHSVPPTVPLEKYLYLMELLHTYVSYGTS